MKALTLHEPWATAVAMGLKSYETRGWKTKYRGWLAIHAATTAPAYAWKFTMDNLHKDVPGPSQWSRGRIVAVAKLVDVLPVTSALRDSVTEQERFWGDWSDDRYVYKLENVIRLARPIAAKGAQRIWNWPYKMEYCDDCDVCGWVEGGKAIKTPCGKCDQGIRVVAA